MVKVLLYIFHFSTLLYLSPTQALAVYFLSKSVWHFIDVIRTRASI